MHTRKLTGIAIITIILRININQHFLLQDVLSDASISFRKSVIISMIQDLISGIAYIHHSPILCHGHLKSSNCLVNSYFRLKVSDFGINRLRELNPNKSPAVVGNIPVLHAYIDMLGL